ncbi:MAG: hypothetical protein R3B90_20555 [Planctomycetaceae bacterium]
MLNFDGINVEDESHLIHRVSLTPVNKTVRVVVLRNGREVTLHVTLMELPRRQWRHLRAGAIGTSVHPQQSPRHLPSGVLAENAGSIPRRGDWTPGREPRHDRYEPPDDPPDIGSLIRRGGRHRALRCHRSRGAHRGRFGRTVP